MVFKAVANSIAERRFNDSQPVFTKDVKISAKRLKLAVVVAIVQLAQPITQLLNSLKTKTVLS